MKLHTSIFSEISFTLSGLWDEIGAEFLLAAFFCAGFALFRISSVKYLLGFKFRGKNGKTLGSTTSRRSTITAKDLEAHMAVGNANIVLEEWRTVDRFTAGSLRAVLEAFVAQARVDEIPDVVARILAGHGHLRTPYCLAEALDVIPGEAVAPGVAGAVLQAFAISPATRPRRPAGQVGSTRKRHPPSSVAREQLKNLRCAVHDGEIDRALDVAFLLADAGHLIPPAALVAMVRVGSEQDRSCDVIGALPSGIFSPEVIYALLEHAARTGSLALMAQLRARAKKDKFTLSQGGYEIMLRALATAGDSSAVEVFEDMLAERCKISESALVQLVSFCAESRHVQFAEHIANCCRQEHGRLSLAMYSALMKVYGQARLFHKTCDLYHFMQKDAVRPDTVVYGSLIKAAVESGRLELARCLFNESGNPDMLNYVSLIRAAGRERNLSKALHLLDELEQSFAIVDATVYNCVLDVCVACNDRAAAEELLKRMERVGSLDVVSYNTYLKLVLAGSARDQIPRILAEMRSRAILPNVVTYNSIVKGAISAQDLKGAWSLVQEMEEEGIRPDAFTCSILVKGIKHAPCAEDVDRILDLMVRAKVTPDEVLTNCLLDACVRLNDVQRLTKVLDQFKARGVLPSPHALATLIKAYGHARRPDKVWQLWRDAAGTFADGPNEELVVSMVDACLAGVDMHGAASVIRDVRPRLGGFGRSPALFSAIVKACVHNKELRLAIQLYEEVKDEFQCTRVTYNALIDALVRQGDLVQANSLFRDMTLKAVNPDLITYSTLIKGLCACGDLEQGLQLMGQMKRRGIAPDAVLFNSILDGCAHKQMRALTEHVLLDMESAGIAPSNFTLSILVKLYGRCGDLDAALHVVKNYPAKYGFELNSQVYTCLMSTCIAKGELNIALDTYAKMINAGCKCDAKTYHTILGGCVRGGDVENCIRIMNDALDRLPAINLDGEVIESVLLVASRHGQGACLAAPLLRRLQVAGVSLSQRVISAVYGHHDSSPRMKRSSVTFAVTSAEG